MAFSYPAGRGLILSVPGIPIPTRRGGFVGVIGSTKENFMTDEFRKLTREELEELAGEALPERAAMSLVNANVAAPVNLAAALNVLSDNSTAYANAQQTAPIIQQN
jgi:hypothetical protein